MGIDMTKDALPLPRRPTDTIEGQQFECLNFKFGTEM